MHGKLTIKKASTDIYKLTIYDISKHLKNIQEIEFELSEAGNDYFDVVMDVYREASSSSDEADVLMTGLVRKELIKLFTSSDTSTKDKLTSLGASDIDFALLSNNDPKIKEWALASIETNPYILAKQTRFLDIAKENTSFNPYSICVSVGDESIPLGQLKYTAFKYSPQSLVESSPSTLFINVQSVGNKAWNYTRPNEWLKYIKPFFSTTMLCGDGVTYLLAKDILNFLNFSKKQLSTESIGFAFVRINMHDSLDTVSLGPIIDKFPSFAKETLYVVSSCYSGQYHKVWSKDVGHLLTTSGDNESSYTTNSDKVKFLDKYIKDQPDTLSLLRFFGSEYVDSTPHLTGLVSGKPYQYKPLKDALKEIDSTTQITLNGAVEGSEVLALPSTSGSVLPSDRKVFTDGKSQVTTFSIFPPILPVIEGESSTETTTTEITSFLTLQPPAGFYADLGGVSSWDEDCCIIL